jgi:histone acetyltransferase (RNA polymerase elongator complex component)
MSGCSNPKIKLLNYSSNPDDYKHHNNPDPDIETIYNDDIIIEDSKLELYKELIQLIEKTKPTTDKDFDKLLRLDKQFKHLTKSKAYLLKAYNILVEQRELTFNKHTYNYFIKKRGKSLSGVLVITVVMSPKPDGQNFSCEWNCYFCPNEPGQPRSYLHDEPAVLRANRNEFDVISQILDRLNTLEINGHPIDKIELLILGGTFTSYPTHYQEKFMRDIFYND